MAHKTINPWWIAVAVIVPTFMEVLDTTIMSVSLPNIAGNLSASNSEATWVQTSYLISNAVVLPACAWFSSFFGRKRFLLACILLFTFASMACGMAPSLGVLLLARIVQGAGGGALQPISQAILLESFPQEKHGEAMAAYGLGIFIAPVLGPILGGWVTDNYSWRWLFYMNVPIGLFAWWMVNRFVFDPDYIRDAKPGRIDRVGFGFLILWLGTMQIILDKGQDADWFNAAWIRWFTLISSVSFISFVVWQLRIKEPLADLRVFKNRNFTVGTVIVCIAAVMLYAPTTLLPLFLQTLLGYTSYECGVAQIPRGLGMLVFMPIVGVMVNKCDNRKMIGGGMLIVAVASLGMAKLNLEFRQIDIFWPNFFQGVGMAFCMVPLMTIAMGTLKKEQMGNATGIFALARNLAGSIGISMVTAMLARWAQQHQADLVGHTSAYNPIYQNAVRTIQNLVAPHAGAVQAHGMADGLIYQTLIQQSTLMAYMDDFRWLAVICSLAVPLAFFLKQIVIKKGTPMVH